MDSTHIILKNEKHFFFFFFIKINLKKINFLGKIER